MYPHQLHVFTECVGGGFGGKQEMLTEDLCVLAVLKTGRPVKWEFTREEQFIGATTRHPMKTHVKLGAKKDGTLTAIADTDRLQYRRLRQSWRRDPRAALGSPLQPIAARTKRRTASLFTLTLFPAAAFAAMARAIDFAIECAIDELARSWASPFTFRRKNMIRRR